MPSKPLLILGGTGLAKNLAVKMQSQGFNLLLSFAGVTEMGEPPQCPIRRGGFGGVEGLKAFLSEGGYAGVIDATHPFAAQISLNAYEATQALQLTLWRLDRLQWQPEAGDHWHMVEDMAAVVAALPPNARVLVTTGRKGLRHLFDRADLSGVIRMIEPPAEVLPSRWQLILARPPFGLSEEEALMHSHKITHLLTKNSGGFAIQAKLIAARQLAISVIMLAAPAKPPAEIYSSIDELLSALRNKFRLDPF